MNSLKMVAQVALSLSIACGVSANAANAPREIVNSTSGSYVVTTSVENAGEVVASWKNVLTVQEVQKGQTVAITNVVSPKQMNSGYQSYYLGFDIKMNLSRVGATNQLAVMASYTTPQPIAIYTQKMEEDDRTLAMGQIKRTPLKTAEGQQTLNTIGFSKVYDVTVPRGINVPIARFVLQEGQNQSLVTVKLKVDKQ